MVTRQLAAARAEHSAPCLGVSRCTCTLHQQSPGFPQPSICRSSLPTSQGGLSPPCRNPGLGCPVFGSSHSLPRVRVCPCNHPFPLSPFPGAYIPTQSLLFFFYLIMCVSFLQPWLYKSVSASFQLVFSENCSTCRCIFVMFMGRDNLHILLLHHLAECLSYYYEFLLSYPPMGKNFQIPITVRNY